jgi:hypothetical protein
MRAPLLAGLPWALTLVLVGAAGWTARVATARAEERAAGTDSKAVGVTALPGGVEAVRNALRSVPALAQYAADFVPFTNADVDAALKRGGRSRDGIALWRFQPSAFAWRPREGRELWVLSGRAGTRALIALLERKGTGFEHAASLLIDERDATVAIGYGEQHPEQLVWTTCHGCAGEGGTIRSRDDGRIEFVYR